MDLYGGEKIGEAWPSNNIGERLTGRKLVRERQRTSERGYCRIISVAQAIARVTGIIRNILYYLLDSPD